MNTITLEPNWEAMRRYVLHVHGTDPGAAQKLADAMGNEAPKLPRPFAVLCVTHITRKTVEFRGFVQAFDHDEATRLACERDLIHDFETFRVSDSCEWFALCENTPTGSTSHPVLGDVPTCDRCASFVEANS